MPSEKQSELNADVMSSGSDATNKIPPEDLDNIIAFGIPILSIDDEIDDLLIMDNQRKSSDFDYDSENINFYSFNHSSQESLNSLKIKGDVEQFIVDAQHYKEAILIADFSMPTSKKSGKNGIHLLNHLVESSPQNIYHCFIYSGQAALSDEDMRSQNSPFNGRIERKGEFTQLLNIIHNQIKRFKGAKSPMPKNRLELSVPEKDWESLISMVSTDLLNASSHFDKKSDGTFMFRGEEKSYYDWNVEIHNPKSKIGISFVIDYVKGIMKFRHQKIKE